MKGKTNILVSVLCMTAVMTSFMATGPILSEIQKSFPNSSSSQIQMVYTLGSLVALPIMLLAGRLVHYIPKKYLVLIGLCVMQIGGLLPIFLHSSLWMLYLSSSLLGIGMACVNVMSATVISDHFAGPNKGTAMGYQAAAFAFGGAIFTWATGAIAANVNWVASYWVYICILPVIILVAFLLPRDEVVPTKQAAEGKRVIGKALVFFAILNFLCAIFINAFNANIAMFLDSTGLGGADVSGIVTAVFMLIGIPSGMVMGHIMKKLGRTTVAFMTLCIALGMFCIAFAQSLALVYLGTFLVGFGFAVRTPSTTVFASNLVPAASAGMGIALVNSFGSIGNFASPIVVNAVSDWFGGAVRATFTVGGVGLVVLFFLYLAMNPVKKESLEQAKSQPVES